MRRDGHIDPPYQNTTGYGHDLALAEVLALAERWRLASAHEVYNARTAEGGIYRPLQCGKVRRHPYGPR